MYETGSPSAAVCSSTETAAFGPCNWKDFLRSADCSIQIADDEAMCKTLASFKHIRCNFKPASAEQHMYEVLMSQQRTASKERAAPLSLL